MSQALYRKYRPQTFADVTGQNHIKITLKNQIATGNVAHAYLFAGPRGIGKTTMARLLSKAVNCENRKDKESEPCNKCVSCEEMARGQALDVIEIDAASHTGVDNVRENIIEAVRFAPSKGKYKVFIIDEAHMLSTSAFNALLKTLEEPPAHAIFVLATTEVHKLPATILSRCQRFDFHRIPSGEIVKRLKMLAKGEGVKVSDEVLSSIARLSEGCLRDAESLLGQIMALGEKEIGVKEASIILPVTNTATVVELTDAISRKDIKSILITLNTFVDQGGSVKNLTDELIEFIRHLMLSALGGPTANYYDETTMARLVGFNKLLDAKSCAKLLDELLAARLRPTYDALVQLPLEIALVSYCLPENNIEFPKVKLGGNHFGSKNQEEAVNRENQTSKNNQKLTNGKHQFTLEDLQSKWKRCCEAVGKRKISLPLVLLQAKPLSVVDGIVEVGFENQFHFETLNSVKNTLILEEAINEVMGSQIRVKPVYNKQEQEKTISTLVEAFGGSVIE